MNIAKINKLDTANGIGVRTSVFVSGCEHYCKGCFNSDALCFDYGDEFTEEIKYKVKEYLNNPNVVGLSILGGEPLHPRNLEMTLELIIQCPPHKTIWLWTGYKYETLLNRIGKDKVLTNQILMSLEILVDGKFELDKKDLNLKYRGSSNQRVIDVQKSRKERGVVLWNM